MLGDHLSIVGLMDIDCLRVGWTLGDLVQWEQRKHMNLEDLASRGVQQELLAAWRNAGIAVLTECQERVLSFEPVWEGKNTLVVAPTSSGKTFVGEVLAARSAYSLSRAIFLVPFKAIAEEKYAEFKERYSGLGISVVISDGDHNLHDRDIRRGDFGIAVIVYEKMAQLLTQSPGILADCSLIVIDEIQLIADQTRGPSLELLLAHFRLLQKQPQLIGLSATISDLGGLDSWLEADVVTCLERPVPLWEGVVSATGICDLENVGTGRCKPRRDFSSVPVPSNKPTFDVKLRNCYSILQKEGFQKQTMIFRTQVDLTIKTAKDLAHVLPTHPVSPEVRERIAELESTWARDFLEQWIDKRIAYHNAGLSLDERRLIERLFREGVIRTLVTTSTLAAGVNTPADVVIILDYKRWDSKVRSNMPISVEEYKNSVGRAGRFGITSEGRSYLVAERPNEERLLKSRYLFGETQQIRSAIPISADPGSVVLGLLSFGLVTTEYDLRESLRNSYAYNYGLESDEDREQFLTQFLKSVDDLKSSGLIGSQPEGIFVTELGKVASSSGLSLESFFKLLETLKHLCIDKESVFILLPVLCHLKELRSKRPYDASEREQVLKEWMADNPAKQIIEKYSGKYELGYGNIRDLGETAAWLLRTAVQIVSTSRVSGEHQEMLLALEGLANRCQYGVTNAVVPIAELRVLRRSELHRLNHNSAGKRLDTLHKILDTPLSEFAGILSLKRAKQLQSAILERIGESISRRKLGHMVRAGRFDGLKDLVEQCYKTQGKDFEKALEELFTSNYLKLKAFRFGQQRSGQPDLEISGTCGTIVIQATASEGNSKPVNWTKAREVTSSVGYSGNASNFVTIGRPGFHEVAVGNASEIADRCDQKLLLISLPDLVEICLLEIEGSIQCGTLLRVLETTRGHYSRMANDMD